MQGFTALHGMHRLRCVTKVSRQGFSQDRLRRCKSFVFRSPKKGNHHEVTGGFADQEIISVKIESAGWLLQLWRHRIFLVEAPTLLKKENKRPAPPTFSDKVGSNKPPPPPPPPHPCLMHAKNLLLFDKQNIYHTEYLTIC